MRLRLFFPNLVENTFQVSSPASEEYNCIAWALGRTDAWVWPDEMEQYEWPPDVPREETVGAFASALETWGFLRCGDDEVEDGFFKVALYAKKGVSQHAARQLPSGLWTSKMGNHEDIEHRLDGLAGNVYGTVVAFFKKRIEPRAD